MELQRILARDTRSAMEKVLNLYGEDAMIVANNKVKGQTEIIVAIDLVSEVKAALSKGPQQAAIVHTIPSHDTATHEINSFGSLLEAQVFDPVQEAVKDSATDSAMSFGTAFQAGAQPARKIKSAPPKPARDPLIETPQEQVSQALNGENYKEAADREYLKAREIVDLVKQELSLMRSEFKLAQQKDSWNGTLAVAEEMRPLVEAFNETGMPLGLRESVIEVINQSTSMSEAIAEINSAIGDEIETLDLLDNLQGVHIIAGSSGSGKTLMAGRLAKQMAQKYGDDQVALISFNDARIGAWAQTQLIGSQAGVETFRASSIDMLMQLVSEIGERKLILIDTSGVDIESHINQLDSVLPEAQKHLVVAADASETSAKRQLKSDGVRWDSVMLSRFEGDVHPWAIIYLLLNNPVPLSLAAIHPTIADSATPLDGFRLAGQALSQLPLRFG